MLQHLATLKICTNFTQPTGLCNFVSLWKNLLVLIYSKLHLKSCDYLYKSYEKIMYNILKKKRDSFSEAKRAHQVQKSFIQTVRSVKQPRTMKTIIYNDIFTSLRRKKVQSPDVQFKELFSLCLNHFRWNGIVVCQV